MNVRSSVPKLVAALLGTAVAVGANTTTQLHRAAAADYCGNDYKFLSGSWTIGESGFPMVGTFCAVFDTTTTDAYFYANTIKGTVDYAYNLQAAGVAQDRCNAAEPWFTYGSTGFASEYDGDGFVETPKDPPVSATYQDCGGAGDIHEYRWESWHVIRTISTAPLQVEVQSCVEFGCSSFNYFKVEF